jgi:hypothetical protein
MHAFVIDAAGVGSAGSGANDGAVTPTVVVASLVPSEAVLPAKSFGAGASVVTDSAYPFSDNATVTLTAGGTAAALKIRIPGWAVGATVNGAAAKNGTFVTVPCPAGKATSATVELHPKVRIEHGWGSLGVSAGEAANYTADAAGAPLPTSSYVADLQPTGGASFVGSREPGHTDLRSGSPGQNSSAVVMHPLFGVGHYVDRVTMSFKYTAGYTPGAGQPAKLGSQLVLVLLDAATSKELQTVWTSEPLDKYSFDNYKGYSPLQKVDAKGFKVPNSALVLLALKVINNQRNVQLQLDPKLGFDVAVHWSADVGPDPPVPPGPFLTPPTDAAIVSRGALLFALHPPEIAKVVTSYEKDLPARPDAVDYEISTNASWNYALQSGEGGVFVDEPSSGWSPSLPFSTDDYPFYISVKARQVPAWGYWAGSKITDAPPASPVDCGAAGAACGPVTELKLVPFGGTNIRISVFPWLASK